MSSESRGAKHESFRGIGSTEVSPTPSRLPTLQYVGQTDHWFPLCHHAECGAQSRPIESRRDCDRIARRLGQETP
jgi:hypothetical protein